MSGKKGKKSALSEEARALLAMLKALRKHYINPTKQSTDRFKKEFGTLSPEALADAIAQILSAEGKAPGEWQDIIAEHKTNLFSIIESVSDHNVRTALHRYLNNHKALEDFSPDETDVLEKIHDIIRERQSFVSKLLHAAEEAQQNSSEKGDPSENDESDDSDDADDSNSDDTGDGDDTEDGDDGDTGDDGDNADSDSDNQDSDGKDNQPSDQDASQSQKDQQQQDKNQKPSQNDPSQDPSKDDAGDDTEDSNADDGDSVEEDPDSYADDSDDDADGESTDSDSDDGEEDDGDDQGDSDGDSDGDGDTEGDPDSYADDSDDDANGESGNQEGEEGENGDGDGENPATGKEAPPIPPESTYNLSDEDVDPAAVQRFAQALSLLIARDVDDPTDVPRWNTDKLIRRMLEPGSDIMRAKEPTQIPQDVMFIFDNSPSMTEFAKIARKLAKALGDAGALGSARIVTALSSNGEYSQNPNKLKTTFQNPFHPAVVDSDDGGWYINGKFMGALPFDLNRFKAHDHCLRWEKFIKEELPRKHNVNPRVILYFSDDHGAIQWCYLSQKLTDRAHIWLDPNEKLPPHFPKGQKAERAVKWPRNTPEEIKGMTTDGLYDKESNVDKVRFTRFKGTYFTFVKTVEDVCKALSQVSHV